MLNSQWRLFFIIKFGMEYGNVSSLEGHSGIFIRSKMLSSKGIIFFPVKILLSISLGDCEKSVDLTAIVED